MWLIWRKLLKNNNENKWHSNTNPRSGQYLTHAHSHMTRAVAAMDSCFGLVRPHQHGIAVAGQQIGQKALCTLPFTAKTGAKHPFKLVCENRSYTWLFFSTGYFITLLQIIKLLWHLPDTLGKYPETIVWHSDNVWRIFGKCSEIFGKSSKKSSLVCYAHSWDIKFNTRRQIPYLRPPMYYPLFIACNFFDTFQIPNTSKWYVCSLNIYCDYLRWSVLYGSSLLFYRLSLWLSYIYIFIIYLFIFKCEIEL